MMKTARSFFLSAFLLLPLAAQLRQAPPMPRPDDRYKADILVIVAHPDDESLMTGYLAKAIYDEHKRVAVVFGTRGNSGGNAMGNEQADSLGAEREIEGRRALATFGVFNVWFLDGPDTPGQDVLRSLETWNHGQALWKAVRIVRLTRPEVILTWLPDYSIGENHGDHQAAGVIATEAFDIAGNPTVFPEQIAAPRDRNNISNLTEGLHPWQPQKIYYGSDALNTSFMDGKGPQYSMTEVSPARGVPYYRLVAEAVSPHLTQGDSGQVGKHALDTNDFTFFKEPEKFIFGKSLVGGSTTGDILENVSATPIAYTPPLSAPYRPQTRTGVSVELGGPWAFYREFWRAHAIEHIANVLAPEAGVGPGEVLHLPILIHNDTNQPVEVTLTSSAPQGWVSRWGVARYPVAAGETYATVTETVAPNAKAGTTAQITWNADANGHRVGSITVKAAIMPGVLPQ